jgi:hypothetical protein
MDAVTAIFPAAPLDGLARAVTALVWVLAAVFVAAGASMSAAGSGWPGILLAAVGVLLAVMSIVLRRLQPVSYALETGAVSIRRRSAPARRFEGSLTGVHPGRLGWRVFGDGGGYGYLGRYRAEGRTVQAFVTDRTRVVLLDVGAAGLAVSPADPHAFVAEVALGA